MSDRHGITEEQWLEFCEGSGDAAQNERIAAHLRECAPCSLLYEELNEWNSRLATEGHQLRAALKLPEAAREAMLAKALARVSAMTASREATEGIVLLHSLLGPVFGAGTVRATIGTALRAAAPGGISGTNWRAFAAQLSDAIQLLCGHAAGRLAERAALSLAIAD